MKYWFTADYHLGHYNIIKYCNRPFKTLDDMNNTIIRNHNARVSKDDIVFHLGDFCFKNSSDKENGIRKNYLQWEQLLNGKIIHIQGNHDKNNTTKTIIQGLLIYYGTKQVYCVHRPEHFNPKYLINFVGHVHEKWERQQIGNTLLINVGVDVNKFMPKTFDELIYKKLKAS